MAVTAAPLSALPVDPITGLPLTSSVGDVLVLGSPSPPGPPGPPPPPPPGPPAAPSVTLNSAAISSTQTTLVIAGSGFAPLAADNVVTLSSGTVGSISAASTTSLTIVFGTQPGLGPLSASVTAFGLSSGAPVVVATVRVPVVVTSNSATITLTTFVIAGSGFAPLAADNVVTLSSGTVGSISAASTTSLTIVFGTQPSAGPLLASVTAFGLSSGAAVQVATVAVTLLVANIYDNTVTQCAISGGSITSCAIPAGVTWNLNNARGMAVANNVAYITNVNGNTVTECQITSGSITSCAVPTGFTWNLAAPYGIAVVDNVAYIVNSGGNSVTQCQITSGSITSCAVPSGVTWNLNYPTGIAIANNIAYITDYNGGSITQCAIVGGSITSCVGPSVSGSFNAPGAIAVANDVAYIPNFGGNTVSECAIVGGSITSCTVPAGVTWNLSGPFGIALASNVAYISSSTNTNTITQCEVIGGSITSCAIPSGVTWNMNGPLPMALI